MSHIPYSFEQVQPTRYKFLSIGKNKIEKIVDFVPLKPKYVMNLGFGDLLADGTIDDKITSNNGDIGKVLATVITILKHFTALHPHVIIVFYGSTAERTRLYTRVLKMHHAIFNKDFVIYGILGTEQDGLRLPFDPCAQVDYFAFLIKRINF
jgi:hypothetical protein